MGKRKDLKKRVRRTKEQINADSAMEAFALENNTGRW